MRVLVKKDLSRVGVTNEQTVIQILITLAALIASTLHLALFIGPFLCGIGYMFQTPKKSK